MISRVQGLRRQVPALAQEAEEFDALAQPPLHHVGTAHHLADDGGDFRRAEIELLVERLDRIENLGMAEMGVGEGRDLRSEIGQQLLVLMCSQLFSRAWL